MSGPGPAVSVLLWSAPGVPGPEAALEALRTQVVGVPWEVHVVVAGEGDAAAVEALAAALPVPVGLSRISAEELDRGDVRNLLAVRSRGELLVYLDPGVRPGSDAWLAAMLGPFEDEHTAAVWPPEDGPAEADLEPGDGRPLPEGRAALALRRSVWELHPFPRSEGPVDRAVVAAALAAGRRVAVAPAAARPEGRALAGPPAARSPEPTAWVERRSLSVLYVVHGFPPDTWAGTEVYTLGLAREMQALGHRVTILAREPAERPAEEGGPAEFSVREDRFEDLRVLRWTRRLVYDDLRETYDDPRAIVAFREVLLRERPDLVHFQHLIHAAAGLVQVARGFGLPTIVHCHDYWALCARVQMVRPGGEICARNMGAGCYLCVHDRALSQVERLERAGRAQPEALAERVAAERAERDVAPARRTPRGRRWQGLGDLLERHGVVTAAYAAADLRVSPSRFLRRMLVEAGGFDPRTTLYSDNGMRTDHVRAVQKRPDPQGRVRLGFVGSLVWYKGCEVLVRAMNLLAEEPLVLRVHGDYRPEEDAFHARLRDLATAGNVEFLGRFDNARLSEVYAELDVLVVPSTWYENSPITIHEAFLARTPVVASGIGGMAEYVRDGVDGLHFRVGDAEDLARVLRRFAEEPDLLGRLGGDWIPIKDLAENGRETEFRYRQLLSVRRERPPLLFYDRAGRETSDRRGPAEDQGESLLLLRPGAVAEYDVSLAGGGPREVRVELVALAGEPGLRLGGEVRVDGALAGRLPRFASRGRDETRVARLAVDLPAGCRRLALLPRGRRCHLRVARVTVLEAPPEVRSVGRWKVLRRRVRGILKRLVGRSAGRENRPS